MELSRYREPPPPLRIDGNLGEGGGQVLRIALSLSVLYGIPIQVVNIRAGRRNPGLAMQHLKGVQLLQEMCNALVNGGYVGSTQLEFYPGLLSRKTKYIADTQTAGCIALLAQVALPCALFVPSNEPITLILRGGTNVPLGPQIDYLIKVFRPMLNKFGANFDYVIVKRGFYPEGGGEVRLIIKPILSLKAVTLTELGVPQMISGTSFVAGVVHINEARKMSYEVKTYIIEHLKMSNLTIPDIVIEEYKEDRGRATGNGSGINVVCKTTKGCVLGGSGLRRNREEKSPSETTAQEILKPLANDACVDEHMQDQIIILMALAEGTSKFKVGSLTGHTETAIMITEIMLGNRGFRFNKSNTTESTDTHILECKGCGLKNTR